MVANYSLSVRYAALMCIGVDGLPKTRRRPRQSSHAREYGAEEVTERIDIGTLLPNESKQFSIQLPAGTEASSIVAGKIKWDCACGESHEKQFWGRVDSVPTINIKCPKESFWYRFKEAWPSGLWRRS